MKDPDELSELGCRRATVELLDRLATAAERQNELLEKISGHLDDINGSLPPTWDGAIAVRVFER